MIGVLGPTALDNPQHIICESDIIVDSDLWSLFTHDAQPGTLTPYVMEWNLSSKDLHCHHCKSKDVTFWSNPLAFIFSFRKGREFRSQPPEFLWEVIATGIIVDISQSITCQKDVAVVVDEDVRLQSQNQHDRSMLMIEVGDHNAINLRRRKLTAFK